MSSGYSNFGDFIAKKREERRITLREMARRLDVSAPFLSDVEKDRRNPFDSDRLEKIAGILELNKQERELMYDLAGKRRNTVAPDLPEYIMGILRIRPESNDIIRHRVRADGSVPCRLFAAVK